MTQLITSILHRVSRAAIGLLGTLCACSGPQSVAPEPLPELASTPPSETDEAVETGPRPADTGNVSTPETFSSPEPLAGWAIEYGLKEFHATWTEFGAITANGAPGKNALIPYANAVAYQGESWGLSSPTPELILLDPQGHAYRYPSGQHGVDPALEARVPANAATMAKLGLSELRDGAAQHVTHDGSTLHVLAALRATGRCAECHDGGEGRLLGAYHYTFHEIADD